MVSPSPRIATGSRPLPRGTHGHARPAADAGAAILPQVVHRMAEMPQRAIPAQRQTDQREFPSGGDARERGGEAGDGQHTISGRRRCFRHGRLGGRHGAFRQQRQQAAHHRFRRIIEVEVGRQQRAMVEAPAIVDPLIGRDLHHVRPALLRPHGA
jgi:hypothetical protein